MESENITGWNTRCPLAESCYVPSMNKETLKHLCCSESYVSCSRFYHFATTKTPEVNISEGELISN
jgi:hypothetical protein